MSIIGEKVCVFVSEVCDERETNGDHDESQCLPSHRESDEAGKSVGGYQMGKGQGQCECNQVPKLWRVEAGFVSGLVADNDTAIPYGEADGHTSHNAIRPAVDDGVDNENGQGMGDQPPDSVLRTCFSLELSKMDALSFSLRSNKKYGW